MHEPPFAIASVTVQNHYYSVDIIAKMWNLQRGQYTEYVEGSMPEGFDIEEYDLLGIENPQDLSSHFTEG